MPFLNKKIADALCTVITLGFAREMEINGQPLRFEYEDQDRNLNQAQNNARARDAEDHRLLRDAFTSLGVHIDVGPSAPQVLMPYILGTNLPQNRLNTFISDLHQWADQIMNMFNAANAQNPPRGAYIGVQFFVDANGNIQRGRIANNFDAGPFIYGSSALSLHQPVYRRIIDDERDAIGIAYYNARMSTNNAVRAVTAADLIVLSRFETDYLTGCIFGSDHGMIRAMVNSVMPPPGQGIDRVFAEIALGDNTKKVSSCIPCAIFMQSFGYPASSIHLGRGDNWRIPDEPTTEILHNWTDSIVICYLRGLEVFNPAVRLGVDDTTLDNAAAMIIASNANVNVNNVTTEIPNLFLEALTFEDSFIERIKRTLFP
jgi:hypothetical protein